MTTAPPSYVRQNYYPECEAAINNQIVLELYASYVYESMASYFSSHEVALKRFAGFFLQQSSQERKHAERLMELQNQRGGHLRLRDISRPDRNRWENGLKAMECALHLERSVNQSLLDLHQLATENKDAHLCAFLSSHCLQGQVEFIKELGDHITKLRKMGAPESGLADYLFDKLTLGDSDKKN
ncbi:ferritin heavy chain-like [Rhinolophus ferrumequinum]|uniref:ferritin heavy chain-like n=1 Tax=Rhinolophus ferrumequinum TaxID=59479 RepID=UPI00140F9653|nr:ferritin heavy chain-like [Rhinolophus ferrumequinum]XP_032958092.1 ferritin heavy chain-like [Rhinolophus ferrumequinum]XP_032969123.1 ferritin heavy chain-like [Rhinolophus ferrumequinum]